MRMAAGAYHWAGPGTIRMIELKFFRPAIDRAQLMAGYDRATLERMRAILGATDMWVSYSWGFSDEAEQEDRAYLRERLGHFRAAGIRAHAYVQGMNLVHAHHPDPELYCRDPAGRVIPYHRGRSLCCPNSPAFRKLLFSRVEAACREEVDGVFIDNLYVGQFPVPVGAYLTDFGCHCAHCRRLFRAYAGCDIPSAHRLGDERTETYLRFRSDSLHAIAGEIRSLTAKHGKMFGSNGLDASLDTRLFYGYDAKRLAAQQDYLLFENFRHPLGRRGNEHLLPLIREAGVPVCVVSYRKVIGRHAGNAQRDLDAIHTESAAIGYIPAYKVSEFTTKGKWHNLRLDGLRSPRTITLPARTEAQPRRAVPMPKRVQRTMRRVISRVNGPMLTRVYERRKWRAALGWLIDSITTREVPGVLRPWSRLRPARAVVRTPR